MTGEEVQAQLDAADAAGGGTVTVDQPVLDVSSPLIGGSSTHLRGVTAGATVVRAAPDFAGRMVSNSYVAAVIGTVGSDHFTVSDLTVDTFTNNVHSNGVALLPTSSSSASEYDGTVCTNATVRDLEIHGAPGFHAYQIWNLRGRHIRYLNNYIDGHATSAFASQEGMETYGGYDVLMQGNTVKNIGNAGIIIGSGNGEIVGTNIHAVRAVDNYLENCTAGVIVTSGTVVDGESASHVLISRNQIINSRSSGIDAQVFAGTFMRDLQISNNTIRGVSAPLSAGILLRSLGPAIGPESVIGTFVFGNHVEGVTGANSFGIYVQNYPKARVIGNAIIATASDGIRVYNSSDSEIIGNRIALAGNVAIGVYRSGSLTSARVMVERNRVNDWSPVTSGVFISGTSRGTVKDNVFSRSDTAVPSPITLAGGTCGMIVSGNVALYLPSYLQPTSAACP